MRRRYTPEEIRFVRKNIKGRPYAEMARLFNERFSPGVTQQQITTLAHKHGLYNGIGPHNGYAPPNKGKTRPSWQGCYKPVGSERIDGGYIFVKISDRKYRGNKNWKAKHVAIFEAANGKVPKGHIVIFADGNSRNFSLDNLMLVSRAELAVMNRLGLISAGKELTEIGKTVADIKLLMSKRKQEAGRKAGKTGGRK